MKKSELNMTGLFDRPQMQTPVPQAPAPMPDPSSAGVLEAKRRAQMEILSRAGRSSTILTAPGQRSGDYSATKLGTAA